MVYLSKFTSVARQLCTLRSVGRCLPKWGTCCRHNCNKPCGMKVTIIGAAGQTGQPLALLLKQCPLLDEIALFDTCPTCGYGMELSHVDTRCKVSSFSGAHMLCDALLGARVVVIVARNGCDTFEVNAPIITEVALQICNVCPNAFTVVATEPVESLTPLVGEIQRLRGCYNPRALLGVVELNCSRANTVLADFLKVPPESIKVPVIGGATPKTMVPVLSAAVNPCLMTQEQVECVTSAIMYGTEAVQKAKGGSNETPSLAGAYSVARTTINVVKGLQGQGGVVQCAYVDGMGCCAPDCQYFSNDVTMGGAGIARCHGVPELTKFENCLLCSCLPAVRNEIARAVWLVYSMCTQCGNSHCTMHPHTRVDQPLNKQNCLSVHSEPCPLPTQVYSMCTQCVNPHFTIHPHTRVDQPLNKQNCLSVHPEPYPLPTQVYSMCTQCGNSHCTMHPHTCVEQPQPPCVPPQQWAAGSPDKCRDEYLAEICRKTTLKIGPEQLCWRPKSEDYAAARQNKVGLQMPIRGDTCPIHRVPRSIRMAQLLRQRKDEYKRKVECGAKCGGSAPDLTSCEPRSPC